MTKKEKHMIAKQYLQRGRDIQRQITQLYEKRSEFFDRATSTTMAISPVKVQTSHSGQGLENAIIGMVDTEEKSIKDCRIANATMESAKRNSTGAWSAI